MLASGSLRVNKGDGMKTLLKKEWFEIRFIFLFGLLFTLCWMLLCLVLPYFEQSSPYYHDRFWSGLLMMIWVITTALIVTPLTDSKESGDVDFLRSLPIQRSRIIFSKICIGFASVFAYVLLTVFLFGSIYHQSSLVSALLSHGIPDELLGLTFFLCVNSVIASLNGAFFKRGITAVIATFVASFVLFSLYMALSILWVWSMNPFSFPFLFLLGGFFLISFWKLTKNMTAQRTGVVVPLLIFFLLFSLTGLLLHQKYVAEFYQIPETCDGIVKAYNENTKVLIFQKEQMGPLFSYDCPTGKIKRIAKRFTGGKGCALSPSGRYLMYDDPRGFGGNFGFGFSKATHLTHNYSFLKGIYWGMIPKKNFFTGFNYASEKIMLLDFQSGTNLELLQNSIPGLLPSFVHWAERSDYLECIWQSEGEHRTVFGLYTPEGREIYVSQDMEDSSISLSDDEEHLIKVVGTNNDDFVRYIIELDKVAEGNWRKMKKYPDNKAPHGDWFLTTDKVVDKNQFAYTVKNNEKTLFLGVCTLKYPLHQWSPQGNFLILVRNDEANVRELICWHSQSRELTLLPGDLYENSIVAQSNPWRQNMYIEKYFGFFSDDDKWLCVPQADGSRKFYSMDSGQIVTSPEDYRIIGWLESDIMLVQGPSDAIKAWNMIENTYFPLSEYSEGRRL